MHTASHLATFGSTAAAPRLPGDDFNVPFEEAIAWARERKAVLPAEFYGARLQAVRARAFTVSGLAALDQIQQVADAAAQATASGQTLREWRKTLAPEVLSLGRARTELIFRNAVQTHYGIGRTIQQRENAGTRPYLMWDAINDGRSRESHAAMDGHVAPVEDPIWQRWHPPAGHNCRCSRISLTQAQAERRGLGKPAPHAQPDAGWEGDPTEGNEDLLRIVKARRAACEVGGSFAAGRGAKAPGLWCDEGAARERMQALQTAVDGGPVAQEVLSRSLGAAQFDQAARTILMRTLPQPVAAAGLTLGEMVAVHAWTLDTAGDPWFARINAMARGADMSPAEFDAVFPLAHALLSALRKLPPFVGTVYRGVKERPVGAGAFEAFVREHETRPEVYHPGFVGASQTQAGALRGRVRLTIESKSGRDISSLSAKPEQGEVLFMPPLQVAPKRVMHDGKVVRIWASEI